MTNFWILDTFDLGCATAFSSPSADDTVALGAKGTPAPPQPTLGEETQAAMPPVLPSGTALRRGDEAIQRPRVASMQQCPRR